MYIYEQAINQLNSLALTDKMHKFIAKFEIRNDRTQGLLVESIKVSEDGEYYFKQQDQPLARHCNQLQNLIRSKNVKRSRKIAVDISLFSHEYYRRADKSVRFKGIKLISTSRTIGQIRQLKIKDRNSKVEKKRTIEEEQFQIERARRIAELQGLLGPVEVVENLSNDSVECVSS